MDWSKAVDWLKLKPRYLLGPIAVGALLLFASGSWIATLGLDAFRQQYLTWIGGSWLIAVAIFLSSMAGALWDVTFKPLRMALLTFRRRRQLGKLSSQEMAVLAEFIDQDKVTLPLSFSGGVANLLEAKRILKRTATLSVDMDNFAYSVQPWAWRYLKRKPSVLDPGREYAARQEPAVPEW